MAVGQGLLVFGAYTAACSGVFAAVVTTLAGRRTGATAGTAVLPWRYELLGHCCCIAFGVEMLILHMCIVRQLRTSILGYLWTISRVSQQGIIPHTPCDVLYFAPALVGCRWVLTIR